MKNRLLLSREAMLLDSPLYIAKSFLSVLTAYLLFSRHSIIGKDMISVLFGMMLTLEPIMISGLRSGISQIKASWVGGVTTALIVSVFGINWLTIPLAVSVTIYISLIDNYREVSPVAIFTAIYMTQYVQYNDFGMPSVLLTLRLRLLALGAGIIIAIFYNYLFSKFFYKKMVHKRIVYVLEKLLGFIEGYETAETQVDYIKLKEDAMSLLKESDYIFNDFQDLSVQTQISRQAAIVTELKNMTLYFLDAVLYASMPQNSKISLKGVAGELKKASDKLIRPSESDTIEIREAQEEDHYYVKALLKSVQKIV